MLAQGVIYHQRRFSLRSAYRFRLLKRVAHTPLIDLILEPWRFREEARQVGFVGAVQNAPGDVRHAFVRKHHQGGQVVLKVSKLLTVLK
jgi:hypothetical protein